jgi:hypothetical protein
VLIDVNGAGSVTKTGVVRSGGPESIARSKGARTIGQSAGLRTSDLFYAVIRRASSRQRLWKRRLGDIEKGDETRLMVTD